jgi:hypothetical protein
MIKPTTITITNLHTLELWRGYHRYSEGWVSQERNLDRLTPSSRRRLFRVISRYQWSAEQHEFWRERGYGPDCAESITFTYPPRDVDKSRWLQYIIAEELVGSTGQGI